MAEEVVFMNGNRGVGKGLFSQAWTSEHGSRAAKVREMLADLLGVGLADLDVHSVDSAGADLVAVNWRLQAKSQG